MKLRRVELPADSPRGGVLTQATFLAVTSNPNRTSPVKRGLFVLENVLEAPPPPPPPPDVPVLEAAADADQGPSGNRPRAAGAASPRPHVRLLPCTNGSTGPRARKFQRARNVARNGK